MTPYYAVIFSNKRTTIDDGYAAMDDLLFEAVKKQKGYLGFESFRNEERVGVNITYWENLEAIQSWKNYPDHAKAQELGRQKWYEHYTIRICKVEREYGFER